MRQFAECTSPWAVCDDDLASLRLRLADAEARAGRASSWTERTRAEQDAKSLRRQIAGAETDRRVQRGHQARQTARQTHQQQAVSLARATAEGRALRPVPCFARAASTCPAAQPGVSRATACTCGRHEWVDETVASNARSGTPVSFAALSAFVEQARQAGMLKPRR